MIYHILSEVEFGIFQISCKAADRFPWQLLLTLSRCQGALIWILFLKRRNRGNTDANERIFSKGDLQHEGGWCVSPDTLSHGHETTPLQWQREPAPSSEDWLTDEFKWFWTYSAPSNPNKSDWRLQHFVPVMHPNESLTFCSCPRTLMFATNVSLSKAQQHWLPGGFVEKSQWIIKLKIYFKKGTEKLKRKRKRCFFLAPS